MRVGFQADRSLIPFVALCLFMGAAMATEFPKPYDKQCTERQNIFEFTRKPTTRYLENDRYEITFAVKGYCDVAAGIVDANGKVIRHLGSGVLGKNAPSPFQKNSLQQKIYWDGKNDLGVYMKDPKTLRVKVMLGLKPTFDKRIGGASAHNLPGYVWGIAIGPEGAYVFTHGTKGHGHLNLRKFDHDGGYLQSLSPPPANLPDSKLKGLTYVEYEKGKRALHGPELTQMTRDSFMFLGFVDGGYGSSSCQPALAGGRLFIPTGTPYKTAGKRTGTGKLVYIYTDGSTDVKGMQGRPFVPHSLVTPAFAVSPDGKTLYMAAGGTTKRAPQAVFKCSADGTEAAEVFIGNAVKPGSDNAHFNNPSGLDCDTQGRLYVADTFNNRIQIYSPKGKWLKTIPVEKPKHICVHKKTGALYILHMPRIKGKTINRLVKLKSFAQPKEEFHHDGIGATSIALDSWTAKPRLWLGGERVWRSIEEVFGTGPSVRIFEEQNGKLKQLMDFDEVAKKEAGASYFGRFMGGASDNRHTGSPKSMCDPVSEKLYYRHSRIFDLKTGAYEGRFKVPDMMGFDDIAIDKRGFMHGHSWGSGPAARVWRVAPSRAQVVQEKHGSKKSDPLYLFPEVPYDYGVARKVGKRQGQDVYIKGALPVKSQACAHPWQHGLGVNMRGDIAVSSRISYMPKMDDLSRDLAFAGQKARKDKGIYVDHGRFSSYLKNIQALLKTGSHLFSIPREPGIPLFGDTIWTFDSHGELLNPGPSAIIGERLAGVQIDETHHLYFATVRARMVNGKPFLNGNGGMFGAPKSRSNRNPSMGTYIKARPSNVKILKKDSIVPMEPLPARPPELFFGTANWIEGAEWLYAGASPIVTGGCECPSSRPHLDWYKRSFVQEVYRHSIGVMDSNGNLIMHLGKYGNFDSAMGDKSKIKVGGDNIGVFMPRYLGGTDNYLVFNDWGERLVVLKLNYHATETASFNLK